jgi:hypothetical protein
MGEKRARGEARSRNGNGVKARSSVEAVPHSANSGDCSREISNACARPLSHTSRRAASVAASRAASAERARARARTLCAVLPWSSATSSRVSASLPSEPSPARRPPPNPGRTDLPPLRSRTTSLDYRRNLCAPVVIKMRHLLAAPASVSVHLPATRAAPLGRTRTTRTRRVVVLVETKKELHWGPS